MNKTSKPPRKADGFKYYGTKENPYILGAISKDYWRGRKDGKIAPAACYAALSGIEAAELRYQEQTRNGILQAKEEAKSIIASYDNLLEANQAKVDSMKDAGTLVPEPVANSEYRAAWKETFIASLLMTFEIFGLADIGKGMFGQGLVSALIIAVLISLCSALLVKYALNNITETWKRTTKLIVAVAGFIFLCTGLLGFVVLRSETFAGGLMGGNFNFNHIWWGNLLLMIGLTLGVPCVSGALYEDASERLKLSRSSRDLYIEKGELLAGRNVWDVQLRKLEEFDRKLDDITRQEISFRKNRYIRGFHIGGRKNVEAANELRRATGIINAGAN